MSVTFSVANFQKLIFFFCFSNHQARKQQAQNNSNQRIKFAIDSSLRIEHSLPFAKDFQLTLSGGGELIRHRVAFFTEDQGLGFIAFLQDKEVQVIRLRDSNRGSARKISFVSLFFTYRPRQPNREMRIHNEGNFWIFLPLRYYVKSILDILKP